MTRERHDPVYDAADVIVTTLQPARATVGHIGNVSRALRSLLGEPTIDRVLGTPLALWDVLRDVQTRLERLEQRAFEERGADRTLAALADVGDAVMGKEPRILSGRLDLADGRTITFDHPTPLDVLVDIVRSVTR